MRYNTEKKTEGLTRALIAKDLKTNCKDRLIDIGIYVFFCFIIVVIAYILICFVLDSALARGIARLIFALPFACFGVYAIIRIKKVFGAANNDTFRVFTDKLVGLDFKEWHGRHVYKTYYLHFACSGKYKIPEDNHRWSDLFHTSDKVVYERANMGDLFYMVSLDGKKIALVYNSKMFGYKEACDR